MGMLAIKNDTQNLTDHVEGKLRDVEFRNALLHIHESTCSLGFEEEPAYDKYLLDFESVGADDFAAPDAVLPRIESGLPQSKSKENIPDRCRRLDWIEDGGGFSPAAKSNKLPASSFPTRCDGINTAMATHTRGATKESGGNFGDPVGDGAKELLL